MFKSLLFFGAGAVLNATGERDMEHLGGLIHRMPQTAFVFLVGCVAISALPPLNGFVSEWLTFQAILLSPQLPAWGLKFLVPAVGALLALSAALAAACFVKAFGVSFPRPAAHARRGQGAGDRRLFARRHVFPGGALPGRRHPAGHFHRRAGAGDAIAGRRAACRTRPGSNGSPSCRSPKAAAPITACWCSFSWSLSGWLAAFAIHRLASDKLRRAPAWDCGYPDPSPATQYTASSFAQPIRRVYGASVFRAREIGEMPPPGSLAPAKLTVVMRDLIWDVAYAPIAGFVGYAADRLNVLQFLTIRRYLTLVFTALVLLLVGARDMAMIRDFVMQVGEMLLVLLLSPLLTGFVRKVKARLLRRQGPPLLQPYRDLIRLMRKEVVLAESASWLFRVIPYIIFAGTWVAASLVPTFGSGLLFSWSADLIAIIALLGSARFFLALAGLDVGTSFGGIGSSREVMIASLAEPAMLMIVFTLALVAGSTQLSTMATYMVSGEVGLRVSLGMALLALIIVAIAENARIPVDNPATHLELTMVHEAMVLEYSGRHLALIDLSSELKLLLYVSVIGCLFAPWGITGPDASPRAIAIGLAAYIAKLAVGGVLLAVFETAIAKMRVFRVPAFLGVALMLGLLATLLLFVSRSL